MSRATASDIDVAGRSQGGTCFACGAACTLILSVSPFRLLQTFCLFALRATPNVRLRLAGHLLLAFNNHKGAGKYQGLKRCGGCRSKLHIAMSIGAMTQQTLPSSPADP